MNKYFQNLIEILDKELEACAKLKELFEAKKKLLRKLKRTIWEFWIIRFLLLIIKL